MTKNLRLPLNFITFFLRILAYFLIFFAITYSVLLLAFIVARTFDSTKALSLGLLFSHAIYAGQLWLYSGLTFLAHKALKGDFRREKFVSWLTLLIFFEGLKALQMIFSPAVAENYDIGLAEVAQLEGLSEVYSAYLVLRRVFNILAYLIVPQMNAITCLTIITLLLVYKKDREI